MWYSAVGCLVTLTLSLLTEPLTATAQPAKIWRIGYLTPAFIPRASLFAYSTPNLPLIPRESCH